MFCSVRLFPALLLDTIAWSSANRTALTNNPLTFHSIFYGFQGLCNQLLNVYIKQQWRQWTALSNCSAQLTCIRVEAVYSYDSWLINVQPVYQSSVSPVNTQPRQSSHQLVAVDSIRRLSITYKTCYAAGFVLSAFLKYIWLYHSLKRWVLRCLLKC